MEGLGSHPQVEAGFEELGSRREEGPAGQLAFARAFLTEPRSPPVAAVGFKTKLGDVLDRDGFAALIRETGACSIVLQRRNVVKAVVSWFRSEAVNRATGDWNVYAGSDRPAPSRIDPDEFERRLERYEGARAALQRYALGLERPTLMLYYEDLLADPDALWGSACGFLGITPMSLAGRAVKATPDDLYQAVTNVDELKAVAGERYQGMFEPAAPSHER